MKRIIIIAFVLVVLQGLCQQTYNYFDATAGWPNIRAPFSPSFTAGNWAPVVSLKWAWETRFTSTLPPTSIMSRHPLNSSGSLRVHLSFSNNVRRQHGYILVGSPQINSLNLSIHLGYQTTKRSRPASTLMPSGYPSAAAGPETISMVGWGK